MSAMGGKRTFAEAAQVTVFGLNQGALASHGRGLWLTPASGCFKILVEECDDSAGQDTVVFD